MGLSSLFSRKKRDKPPKPPSNAEMEVKFQKWFQNASIDDIRSLFLANLLEGNEVNPALLEKGELEHFNKVVAELEMTADGHIEISSVVHRLKQAHGEKAQILESAGFFLQALVLAHAHFPFAKPVSLTKDNLLQAVLLLRFQCDSYWEQRTCISSDDTIRIRPEKRRLSFIFSAISLPPYLLSTRDDIIDVVCRLNYPMGYWTKPKDEPIRKLVRDLEPLAERLQPEDDGPLPGPMHVRSLQPLVDLVAAFPSPWQEPIPDVGFGRRQVVSVKEFVRWAKRVRLLMTLHLVFDVFFNDPKH